MSANPFGEDPEEFLRRQEQKVTELTEQANQMQERLRGNDTTVTSRDGSVTITVNAGGNLQNLHLSPKVEKYTPVRIAQTILQTYQQACAQATQATMEIMSEFAGDDSETMEFLRQQFPTDPDDEGSEGHR